MKKDKKETKAPADQQPAPDSPATPGPDEQPQPAAPAPAPPSPEEVISQLKDKLIRLQADFDNSRKRLEREKADAIRYANESLLESLLPIVDNFHLGLQAAAQGGDAKSIALGMEMVKNQIEQFLHDHEVREVEAPVGGPFDHHRHEAIHQEPSAHHPDGTITAVSRKGYLLRDRLIRPAQVTVAHAASPEKS